MKKKIKILISSIGSLVGQNILDVLEYAPYPRRNLVEIIGTNSLSENPNNFRCDKFFLMPNTSSRIFEKEIIKILLKEKPDLILSGRDEDTETLSKIIEKNKNIKTKLPYGKTRTLTIALDKWSTYKFSQKYDLPFAATLKLGRNFNTVKIDEFIKKYKFPLIAKPVRGFASKGVFFVNSKKSAYQILNNKNYLLQEYIGDGKMLKDYFKLLKTSLPLFVHAPNIHHYSCHLIIKPNGDFSPIFISRNQHNSGMTIGFQKVENSELEKLTEKFANAIYKEGGYGPLTVQFKQDKYGNWKAQEMNFRTNGNTFPRFILGQDDLGLILNDILPEFNFPIIEVTKEPEKYIIGKTLRSDQIKKSNVDKLMKSGFWENI